jgi:hypothetical protein
MDRAGQNELVSQLLILRSTIRISFLVVHSFEQLGRPYGQTDLRRR